MEDVGLRTDQEEFIRLWPFARRRLESMGCYHHRYRSYALLRACARGRGGGALRGGPRGGRGGTEEGLEDGFEGGVGEGLKRGAKESVEKGLEAGGEASGEASGEVPKASVADGGATVSGRGLAFSKLSPPYRSCAVPSHGRTRGRLSISATLKLSFVRT